MVNSDTRAKVFTVEGQDYNLPVEKSVAEFVSEYGAAYNITVADAVESRNEDGEIVIRFEKRAAEKGL